MGRYRVAHNYRSGALGFDEGAVVELDDDVAEWVSRDSPGCLEPESAKAPDRMKRGGVNRGA